MSVFGNSKVARIFLIRHADAAGYREDAILGNHLTALGRLQAQALAERASTWQVDAIICSDLHRAYETAVVLRQYHPHALLRVDSTLRELYIRFDTIPRDMSGFLRALDASHRALERRLEKAWEMLMSIPYDVALVISHRRTIKHIVGRLIGHEQIQKSRLQIANAGITAVEISRAHGSGTLQFVNDTTHLTPEMIPRVPGAAWTQVRDTGRWWFGTSEYETNGDCDLQVGQWVKVRGVAADDGRFIALEVILRAAKKRAGLEGLIQGINHHQRSLRMLNRDITVPEGILVKNGLANDVCLTDLHAGDAIKVSGKWRSGEFVAKRIKVKNIGGLNLEEIEGPISRIDMGFGGFDTMGFSVAITDKTSIEGRLQADYGATV